MRKKIASEIEATLARFALGNLSVISKTVSRFLGRTNRRIILEFLVLIVVLSSVGIAASRWSATTIASHGNLRIDGVGVYDDRNCLIATTFLEWGSLEPGSTRNITVYIRNEGNHQATIFITTENWRPINASTYMRLDSNYNGEILEPMEIVELTLTLSVSSTADNILDFSFDVVIGTNE